ncbi:MAG: zinc-dependent peptidase [Spirochaetes bacterium]|nr:zinc-dependent peptidase [Spirochaetota bacterium]
MRERRRARAAEAHPVPDAAWDWAMGEHPIFRPLDEGERSRLRFLSAAFLAEKDFAPAPDVELDERKRLSIAAQACLPVLSIGLDAFRRWHTIIVVRDGYRVTQSRRVSGDTYEEYEDDLAGEVTSLGPVVLSYRDVEASGWCDGYNVVIHEAAHKLDALDGAVDGSPPLPRTITRAEWSRSFGEAFDDLRDKLDQPGKRARGHGRGRRSRPRIDEYAAEDPGEFFAVACEYFFELPAVLASEYPAVYALLERYFGFSMIR